MSRCTECELSRAKIEQLQAAISQQHGLLERLEQRNNVLIAEFQKIVVMELPKDESGRDDFHLGAGRFFRAYHIAFATLEKIRDMPMLYAPSVARNALADITPKPEDPHEP